MSIEDKDETKAKKTAASATSDIEHLKDEIKEFQKELKKILGGHLMDLKTSNVLSKDISVYGAIEKTQKNLTLVLSQMNNEIEKNIKKIMNNLEGTNNIVNNKKDTIKNAFDKINKKNES